MNSEARQEHVPPATKERLAKGQSLVEVALATRTYLVLLEASREAARLGARGLVYFDNAEIDTLVEQNLSREGYDEGLIDVIIVRATVGPGVEIGHYSADSMRGSGRPPKLTQANLLARLKPDHPESQLIAVEVLYDHQLVIGFPLVDRIFPEPYEVDAYSIMRLLE
jgi:hypothetical protein